MLYVRDYSGLCDPRLYERRIGRVVGLMLHTSDGTNSQGYLQGGVLAEGRVASAEFLVTRGGDAMRLTPKGMATYHAGQHAAVPGVLDQDMGNHALIGVELENLDRSGQVPTIAQHRTAAGIILRVSHVHRLSPVRVFAHSGLAVPMGRRSDPRGLDWGYIMWLLSHAVDALAFDKPEIVA